MARTLITAGRISAGTATDIALPADVSPLAVEQVSLRYGPDVTVHTIAPRDGVEPPPAA